MPDDPDDQALVRFLETLEPGQVREGVVTSMPNFGVFVEIGGVKGLVSVAELSWRHIDSASEVVRIGQEVLVMVLDVDVERRRVSLSLKALQDDPWPRFASTYLGEVVTSRVAKVIPFGVFVPVGDDGIQGLVHIDAFPGRVMPDVGDEITVRISDINLGRRRVKLDLV